MCRTRAVGCVPWLANVGQAPICVSVSQHVLSSGLSAELLWASQCSGAARTAYPTGLFVTFGFVTFTVEMYNCVELRTMSQEPGGSPVEVTIAAASTKHSEIKRLPTRLQHRLDVRYSS